MTPEQFVYWLQGYVEIVKPQERSRDYYDTEAWREIKNHLDLVLTKKTPYISAQEARDLFKLPPLPPTATWPSGTITC